MPEGLPIDNEQVLNGTMVGYAQQLVVCTGKRDWTSRIENDGKDRGWGNLVRGLKKMMGRGGPYLDPFNNILVTNSSLRPSPSTKSQSTASALLFPAFKYIPSIPTSIAPSSSTTSSTTTTLKTFIRAFLLPKHHHATQTTLPQSKLTALTRTPELQSTHFPGTIDILHSPTILICGHGGRDMRCGLMAPALETEFQRVLRGVGFDSVGSETEGAVGGVDGPNHANVGLISHVGGHKYAGNVIVYIPPKMTVRSGSGSTLHPLAGKGIWYGRVEPKHVQGIVDETVLGGRVVTDHFRGGIDRNGGILRL
ncbi:Altered inheritance of mitochondria protein 32 [Penicillium subrubescens]|uniref:Altered inheritance of mitochondria protein 32 n=2 Tax=Penicillium subrubescens TaxID=1316194 RepID=A0A1Q5TE52_9EURO|nr:Altered inheritance of mitochondria protein 32 [Penicillium subrubescens]